jgi:hypothetical protein
VTDAAVTRCEQVLGGQRAAAFVVQDDAGVGDLGDRAPEHDDRRGPPRTRSMSSSSGRPSAWTTRPSQRRPSRNSIEARSASASAKPLETIRWMPFSRATCSTPATKAPK